MTLRLRLRPRAWVRRAVGGVAPARVPRSRRSARAAVVWFAAAAVGLNGATLLAADVAWPRVRDPEYGRRAARLRERLAENPGRPLVLVVGSSRVGAAVCPAAWEDARPAAADRPDLLLFNMGRAGSDPVLQLMMLRRVYADGFRPAVVLLEYWPPGMNRAAGADALRIGPQQVFRRDLPVVRDYQADGGGKFEGRVWRGRLNPIFGLRQTLMLQLAPEWAPWPKRLDVAWAGLDPWGWLPGLDLPPGGSAERDRRVAEAERAHRPHLRAFDLYPPADRALREAVDLARAHGAAAGFVYLPESSEFRAWYPPGADRAAGAHLRGLAAELAVPVIDARTWAADGFLVDGYHLSRAGGPEFTRRLGPAVAAAFPEARP